MRPGLVPIGNDSFFYIISYLIKFVKKNLARFRLRERHMERRFDLLTRQIKTNFWATVWPYVRTDREGGVSGKLVAYGRAALSTEKIAYGGTDRKFGTWPPSRARSTYYYYTTPGRTCQVFFERKNKKNRGFYSSVSSV